VKLPRFARLPRLGASKLISQWLVALLALSIIATLDGGFVASRFALIPSRVWLGEIWRLITWPLVEPGVLTLIMTCVVLYRFGNQLAVRWGDARLQRFMLHILAGAGVITVLASTLIGYSRLGWLGGWAVADSLVIAWARQFPTHPVSIYGLQLSGERLVQFVLGTNVLIAIFIGPAYFLPELAACGLAAYYPHAWLRR
jgi:membrane associated rhomboid family serine protease